MLADDVGWAMRELRTFRTEMLDGLKNKMALRRWRDAAGSARSLPLSQLRRTFEEAQALKGQIDRVIHVASDRMALPRIGSDKFPRPRNADWSWRPEMWRGAMSSVSGAAIPSHSKLGDEITLFHDCDFSELTLRQIRNTREVDLAPFGLRMDVFAFDGSYLALAIDMPPEALAGLSRRHLVRMNTIVEHEKPIEIFARLNIQHGPNTEVQLRELPLGAEDVWVEFDLAYTELNEKRVERMWLDLIFEGPEMNMVTLRDVTFSRAPRAEI